jgi:hypothetical protein
MPAIRVFAFPHNYEHSLNAKRASRREIDDDRGYANYSEPNTSPLA